MKIDIAGKWVWITGASSGLGEALAHEAAARGAGLLLSGRNTTALEGVAAACAAISKKAGFASAHEILAFDLLDKAARAAAVQKALAISGGFALVILNAGVSQRSRFEDLDPAAFDRIMELDFFAPVDLVRRLLPSFPGNSKSGIVLISSLAGLMGVPLRSAYASAKHALTGFGAVLRAEVRERGIAVTTIFPGYMHTSIDKAAIGRDGKPVGKEDPNIQGGADPVKVATAVMAAALAGRPELRVAVTLQARVGLFLTRHFPRAATSMGVRLGKSMAKG